MKNRITKTLRGKAGFTLVELIVVIAILGILAGVGTVGYSGYIKKANMAADEQLLGFVNQAFAAACLENGEDVHSVENAAVVWSNKKVTGVDTYNDEFLKYYGEAVNSEFKVSGKPFFDNVMHAFMLADPTGATLTPAQQAALEKFNASNLSGDEEELAKSANELSNLFAEFLGDGTNTVAKLSMYMDDFDAFKEQYGLSESSTATEVANATVLYVASKASSMNAAEILNTVMTEPDGLTKVMEKNGELPTAALMYGTLTGYANSQYASDAFKEAYAIPPRGLTDVTTLVNLMISDARFNEYSGSATDGTLADMNGYLGAMQIVSNYEDSFDLTDENAFNNEDTLKLLNAILGK